MLKRDDRPTGASNEGASRRPADPAPSFDLSFEPAPPPGGAPRPARPEDEIEREIAERRRKRDEAYAAMAARTTEFERPAQRAEPMIVLQDVTKVYPGDVVGLENVSLQIDRGEWVFLVGPSGSGKSTLIKLILKELDSTRGNVIVGGRNLTKLRRSKLPQLRRNIGCVFQDFKLLPSRTVYENVAYALEVQGQRRSVIDQKVPEMIKLGGLPDGTTVVNCPGCGYAAVS